MDFIYLLNGTSVAVFGMVLSASFCDICWNRKKKTTMVVCMLILLLIQGIVFYAAKPSAVRYLYPVITHIPLMIVLYVFTKKRLWSLVSVFTAYLCCQLRRWLSLFIVMLLGGNDMTQGIVEIIITIPLLWMLLKYIAPAVRSTSYGSTWVQSQFCFIPAVYYLFDYITQIYTNLLTKGNPVVTEFMSFVCCAAYLIFVLRTSEEKWTRNQLEQTQDSLNLQISQAVREIKALRKSQEKTREYRHDLRHHLQYVATCMENGKIEQAQEYIQGICSEIEKNKVTYFCQNETANLIFSAFYGRAKEQGIPMDIKAQISQNIHISESDMCVLLSNALENALHACQKIKDKEKSIKVEVSAFEKNGKIFLEFRNTCDEKITLVHGIPITNQPGHGIGVRSICALVERYNGLYVFDVKENEFILRVSL